MIDPQTTCHSERKWSPEPSCVDVRQVTCQIPSIVHGYYTNHGKNITYGQTIYPYCDTGYTLSPLSSTSRTCGPTGELSGLHATCILLITCNRLPDISNGQYMAGGSSPPYVYNQEITLVCDKGYYIEGTAAKRKCEANDTWSGTDPACIPIHCTPPTTANGTYNVSQQTYQYGALLVLTCYEGYYLSNNASIVRRCEYKDHWSGIDPICQRITCSPPTIFDNGHYNGNQSRYDFGSVLTPKCTKGFYILNNVMQRFCEQHNKWSGENPNCTLVTCKRPASIGNGLLIPDQHLYTYNITIELKCYTGYEVKVGTPSRTCLEDGSWGPEALQCEGITCNDTSDVIHEYVNSYPVITFPEVGAAKYYEPFFHLKNGSIEVNCSADKKLSWINPPVLGRVLKLIILVFLSGLKD